MDLGSFFRNLKIFAWYIVTEPWRQIKEVYEWSGKALNRAWEVLNKLVTIAYISLILAVVSVYTNKKLLAAVLFCLLFFIVLLGEWQSGNHVARYREAMRNKIKKQLEKDKERAHLEEEKNRLGGEKHGLDDSKSNME